MKIWENIVKYVGFIGSIVSILWFVIANPDWFDQRFFDVTNKVMPIIALICGVMAGWSIRDGMKSRDAETKAKTERENAKHAEKMRQERERVEAEKAAAAQLKKEKEALSLQALAFKELDFDAKMILCNVYDKGYIELESGLLDSSDDWARQSSGRMVKETIADGRERWELDGRTKCLFDTHPEVLVQARKALELKRAADNEEATRANPELMLSHMSVAELQTLQRIVDNNGVLDFTSGFDDARFDTLLYFHMLEERWWGEEGMTLYYLDQDLLAFFKRDDNKHLIDRYIADAQRHRGDASA